MIEVNCPGCYGSGEKWGEAVRTDSCGSYLEDVSFECDDCDGSGVSDLSNVTEFDELLNTTDTQITKLQAVFEQASETRNTNDYLAHVSEMQKVIASIDSSAQRMNAYIKGDIA